MSPLRLHDPRFAVANVVAVGQVHHVVVGKSKRPRVPLEPAACHGRAPRVAECHSLLQAPYPSEDAKPPAPCPATQALQVVGVDDHKRTAIARAILTPAAAAPAGTIEEPCQGSAIADRLEDVDDVG